MSAFITIDGLNFTIFMRGLLVVGVGITVLMGSIFLLLATNSGFRTGLFLALTAIFGWLFIMGAVWWIYGIGYKGREASWKVVEMNRGDLTAAQFDKAADLGKGLTTLEAGGGTPTDGLVNAFAEAEKAAKPPEVAGWTGLLASNRSRGEAQATVDAFLIAAKELPSGSYVPVAAFETGGKEKRGTAICHPRLINSDWSGCPDRIWHRIKIAFQPTHPPHYAAIMVQSATPQSLNVRPGEAPPLKVIDESQPLYTVIMERDLGSKRVPSANITIGAGIIFLTLAWRLHKRDRQEMAVRAAYAAAR